MVGTLQSLIRAVVTPWARILYTLRTVGRDKIGPGGAVIVANHVSFVDFLILALALPRPARFVSFEVYGRLWWSGWFLRLFDAILISPSTARTAIRTAVEHARAGGLVCIFPEGEISRTGLLLGLRGGYQLVAKRAGVPVIPAWIDSLWGSRFSYFGGRILRLRGRRLPSPILVAFGAPIPPHEASPPVVRQAMLELGEACFASRAVLRGHVGREALRALARRPWRAAVVDTVPQRRVASRGLLFGLSVALARRWRRTCPNRRLGILLPPGLPGFAANVAALVSGRIPVNLNPTLGATGLAVCLRKAGVSTVITVGQVRERFPDLPWPEDTRDLRDEIRAAGGRRAILAWMAAAWFLPGSWVASWLGVPRSGDTSEMGLLFTSGSSGEPKGALLSHRNVLANVTQVEETGLLGRNDRILACLPIFHSFGFTVTLWYPLLRECVAVTLPSPLDARRVVDTVEREGCTLLITTPTFLRPLLVKARPGQLRTLRFIVTGAEKLPADLHEACPRVLGVPVKEGYGLTETSPVVSCNLPDPIFRGGLLQPATRPGSVGRLFPGMVGRIVELETGRVLPPGCVGMLHLRGPNVFGGYLDDPAKTAEMLSEGWLVTGDLARFDEEGFLYIEGRLSRFSKIGGEMVPHLAVEQRVLEAFGWEGAETPRCAVVGVPDEAKGERLVLLATEPITAEQVRERLAEAGVPNLFIPRSVVHVDRLPLLGSGKLDLQCCRAIALKSASSAV